MNVRERKLGLIFLMYLAVIIFNGCKHEVDTDINISQEMLNEVNKLRKNGCMCGQDSMPPVRELRWNSILEEAALLYAKDMYQHNYFDHKGLDSSLPIQRAERIGYKGVAVGENLARGYTSISEVMQAWKASESHCKNMMDSSYCEMGAATTNQYWVLEFGSTDTFKPSFSDNKKRISFSLGKELY